MTGEVALTRRRHHGESSDIAFGIEGTGSYGDAQFLTDRSHVEVNRPDRVRYRKGKSDPTDAVATQLAASGEGEVEMLCSRVPRTRL